MRCYLLFVRLMFACCIEYRAAKATTNRQANLRRIIILRECSYPNNRIRLVDVPQRSKPLFTRNIFFKISHGEKSLVNSFSYRRVQLVHLAIRRYCDDFGKGFDAFLLVVRKKFQKYVIHGGRPRFSKYIRRIAGKNKNPSRVRGASVARSV